MPRAPGPRFLIRKSTVAGSYESALRKESVFIHFYTYIFIAYFQTPVLEISNLLLFNEILYIVFSLCKNAWPMSVVSWQEQSQCRGIVSSPDRSFFQTPFPSSPSPSPSSFLHRPADRVHCLAGFGLLSSSPFLVSWALLISFAWLLAFCWLCVFVAKLKLSFFKWTHKSMQCA